MFKAAAWDSRDKSGKNAASKALYLQYKPQGDIAQNASLSTAVAYP